MRDLQPVKQYLNLLIKAYTDKSSVKPDEAAAAWEVVPLDWRMRIHEKCDYGTPREIVEAASEMLQNL